MVYTDGLLWWSEGESDRTPVRAYSVTQVSETTWVVREVKLP